MDENTALEVIRCSSCRYMVRETDRVCARCGAKITTRNILAGHATAIAASLGVGLYIAFLGYSSGDIGLVGVAIAAALVGVLGAVASILRIQRRRADFPSARARLRLDTKKPKPHAREQGDDEIDSGR